MQPAATDRFEFPGASDISKPGYSIPADSNRKSGLQQCFEPIEQRFSNPKIADTVRRLCLDGSNRQSQFIIPSIVDRLHAGAEVAGLAPPIRRWRMGEPPGRFHRPSHFTEKIRPRTLGKRTK